MISKSRTSMMGLGSLYAFLLPSVHAAASFAVSVGSEHVWATAPHGLASVTMDFHPGSQGPTWGANASILEIDLDNPALRSAARSLSPAILRLGGSEAGEQLVYAGFPGGPACPPGSARCSTTPPRRLRPTSVWAFEVGNENQATLNATEAARRVRAVRAAVDAAYGAFEKPLVGPLPHIFPDWIEDFVAAAGDAVDIFSYHLYAGYGLAPSIAAQVKSAGFLDDSRSLVELAAAAARKRAPALPVLVSETAAAWNSGAPGVTDSFESGFWYLDHLMSAASSGHVATCRQTLIGGNYSLIDSRTFLPNPDFFVARLWGEVVESGDGATRYLRTGRGAVISVDARRSLRAQAACGADGSLALALANVSPDAVSVGLGGDEGAREEWVLDAHAGDGRRVDLNGAVLEGWTPPPRARRRRRRLRGAALVLAFVRYPNLRPPACA
ncbi:heparanase [Aureococcus anophagefferens]|nr:heparanase [Aureococcus anophagefferens]